VFTSLKALAIQYGAQSGFGTTFVLLTGAAVFAFTLGIAALVAAVSSPLRRRLARLTQADATDTLSLSARLADLFRPYTRYIMPRKEAELSKVRLLLLHAGYRSPNAVSAYFGVKSLLLIALPLLVLLVAPLFPKLSSNLLLICEGIAGCLGFLLPTMWLERKVQKRQRQLRVAFPDAMDLLVVCVEAGLGLAPALQRVADDLMISYPELGGELALVNAEIRAGVERAEALKNLSARTGLEDIRGLVALLVQTTRFGTGVADALRVYAEEFRDKRMQAAEEQAAKMGTKMIFPLIVCLFPSFFLIAVGPAVLALSALFRDMQH
jgi:tight adherence protein C